MKYESLDPAKLPAITDADGGVTGAYRHVQLGKECWLKILTTAMEKVSFQSTRICLRILDLSPGVGDCLKAVLSYSAASANLPILYVGLATDSDHAAFILEQAKEDIASNWLEGKITSAGHTPPQKEPPAEILGTKPPTPDLAVLQWVQSSTYDIPHTIMPQGLHDK